jgi:hypothetical protein
LQFYIHFSPCDNTKHMINCTLDCSDTKLKLNNFPCFFIAKVIYYTDSVISWSIGTFVVLKIKVIHSFQMFQVCHIFHLLVEFIIIHIWSNTKRKSKTTIKSKYFNRKMINVIYIYIYIYYWINILWY